MTLGTYLENHKKVLGWGGGSASFPLTTYLLNLQPPWPPAIGPLAAASVLVSALVAWEWVRSVRSRNRRSLMLLGAAFSVLGLVAYLYLYSQFVEPVRGPASERVIRGYECTAQAKIVYEDACPNLPSDALQNAEWDSAELWTRASVTNVRIALAFSWLLFNFSLGLLVGAAVAGRKV